MAKPIYLDTSKISKTTVMGIIVCALAVKNSIHFDAAGHLLMTARDWLGMVFGFLAAVVGHSQADADRLPPQSPGNPTSESQAAHPVADDPNLGQSK